jgi:hypothetical protein
MAEAGFYHPTSSTAEDRAMCFTCSVCLVCWESSDQPWSEHKRHSSNCSFVKGDHTENVPLSVYSATAGAQILSRQNKKVTCTSSTSCDGMMAVGTDDGYIVIWEITPALRMHSEYQLTINPDTSSRKKTRCSSEKSKKKKKDTQNDTEKTKGPSTLKSLAENAATELQEVTSEAPETIETGIVRDDPEDSKRTDVVEVIEANIEMQTDSDVLKSSDASLGVTEDIEYEGEMYCMIEDQLVSSTIVDGEICQPEVEIKEYCPSQKNIEETKSSNFEGKLVESESTNANANPPNDVELNKKDAESVLKEKSPVKKAKPKTERDVKIASVALVADEKSTKFIVAGVTLETRKPASRDGTRPASHKRKLCLLISKLIKKVVKTSMGKTKKVQSEGLIPIALEEEDNYEMDLYNDEWAGLVPGEEDSDGDYSMFDESAVDEFFDASAVNSQYDTSELSVIDEYLLAAEKKMSAGGGGGTQNLAAGFNQAKEGYEEIEVMKMEDGSNEVYTEDCSFHKVDIPKDFYNHTDAVITHLLVVDGQVIVMLENQAECLSHLIVYSISESEAGSKQPISVELITTKTIPSLIKDVDVVSSLKVPAGFLCDHSDSSDNSSSQLHAEQKSLLVLGLSSDVILFLAIVDGSTQEYLLDVSLQEGRHIHKISYCSGISSIAVCDDIGETSFHLVGSHKSTQDVSKQKLSKNNLPPLPLSNNQIENLYELTKSEPVVTGCYIFFPVNWCLLNKNTSAATSRGGTSATSARAAAYYPPHFLRMVPVEMDKRLLKRTEILDMQVSRLDFVFRMFLLVQTSVSHFDLIVNFKVPLAKERDLQCTIYLDEDKNNPEGSMSDGERILVGPVLFSTAMNPTRTSAQFTLVSPSLMTNRNSYVIIKFEHVKHELDQGVNWSTLPWSPNSDFAIPDLLQDVNIGVYQFKALPPSDMSFPECRDMVLCDARLQEHLVDQLLECIQNSSQRSQGGTIHQLLQILSWIVASHVNAPSSRRSTLPLADIIQIRFEKFLSLYVLFGNREVTHQCTRIILGLISSSGDSYLNDLYQVLWMLVPQISSSLSSSSIHWLFTMFNALIQSCKTGLSTGKTEIASQFSDLLCKIAVVYGKGMKKTQKLIDARHGLTDNILEPLIEVPLELKLRCGACSQNTMAAGATAGATIDTMPNVNGQKRKDKIVSIPAGHLPGIFEAEPLSFTCLSSSEGSRVEAISKDQVESLKTSQASGGAAAAAPVYLFFPALSFFCIHTDVLEQKVKCSTRSIKFGMVG